MSWKQDCPGGENLGSDRWLRGQGGKSNAGALRVPDVGERACVADRERMRDRCWQVILRHLVPAMLGPREGQAARIALHASSIGDVWLRQGRLLAGGDLLSVKLGKDRPCEHGQACESARPGSSLLYEHVKASQSRSWQAMLPSTHQSNAQKASDETSRLTCRRAYMLPRLFPIHTCHTAITMGCVGVN